MSSKSETSKTDTALSADKTADQRGASTPTLVGFVVAAVALVVAVVALVGFGYRAYDVYFNERPAQSAREEAVDSAETAILNVLTIKTSDLKGWQERIDASLTGEARSQVTGDQISKLTAQYKSGGANAAELTARLKRSAAVEVNPDEGTGKVLVYVDATSKVPNQAGVTKTMGFEVQVQRGDGDKWKASVIRSLDSLAVTDPTGSDSSATQTPTTTTTPGGN